MKKLFCLVLIGVTMASFVACGGSNQGSVGDDKKPSVEEDKDNGEEENKDESSDEEDAGADEEKPSEEKPNEEKPNVEKPSVDDDKKPEITEQDKTERIFSIVTMDINYKTVSGGEIKTIGLGVADNIKKILGEVSSKYFDGKPITLSTIETVNGKKIAVVDLGGASSYWTDKFQGSTGGRITEYTLVENVLQKEYKGYWIDGVKFTIGGKNVEDNGHIPNLASTTYRK